MSLLLETQHGAPSQHVFGSRIIHGHPVRGANTVSFSGKYGQVCIYKNHSPFTIADGVPAGALPSFDSCLAKQYSLPAASRSTAAATSPELRSKNPYERRVAMSTRPWHTWLAAIPRLILWILIIGVLATMIFQQIQAAAQQEQRLALIREIQHERQSRVITLIHEKQLISILGIPFRGFIDIEDAEAILQVVRETPPDMPIDMIIHTPGGLALAATQIALALKSHQGRVTVFVPYYAMSGGTLLALAADEIVMDPYAVLGPVDPQLSLFPAVSIIEAVQAKPIEDVDDSTLIMADMAKKAIRQITDLVKQLLQDRMPEEKAEQIAVFLASGRFTHDYPITVSVGRSIGLPISTAVPDSVYRLVALYRKEDLESSAVTSVPRDETARNDLSLTRP